MQPVQQVLHVSGIWQKIALLELNCQAAVECPGSFSVPEIPARDVQVVDVRDLPPRPGISKLEGQCRLLCDLASIELQAMEIGLRTLIEFPDAPPEFRLRLAEITLDEGLHSRLCLEAMAALGLPWGSWPVHVGLWRALDRSDTLLDRILIVHRYLEGAGLDAGQNILKKLKGVHAPGVVRVTERIARDEIAHVQFGSDWYRRICISQGLDPEEDFPRRMTVLKARLPRRLEPLHIPARMAAGFSKRELETLSRLQEEWRSG